ncbi:hypothetical protein BV20DRAFT_1058581 [Pilatotrama ljubarskyi]|nr:hypothetical protein BV20DRAFT_1058581 [Pilatotrama ljubarskyi]
MTSHSACPEVVLATSDLVYSVHRGPPSGESFSRPGRLVAGILGPATYGFVIADLQTLSSDNEHYKFVMSMTIDHTMTFTCNEVKKDVVLRLHDAPGNPAAFTLHFVNVLEFHKMVQLISESKAHLLAIQHEHVERLELLFQAQCAVPQPSGTSNILSPDVSESESQSDDESDAPLTSRRPATADVGVMTEQPWSEGPDDDGAAVVTSATAAEASPNDRGADSPVVVTSDDINASSVRASLAVQDQEERQNVNTRMEHVDAADSRPASKSASSHPSPPKCKQMLFVS